MNSAVVDTTFSKKLNSATAQSTGIEGKHNKQQDKEKRGKSLLF